MRDRIPFNRGPEWLDDAAGPVPVDTPENGNRPATDDEQTDPKQWHMDWTWADLRLALERIPHPALWAALAIGLFVRLSFITSGDFPLNDGGMFYTMALDIQRAGYALPDFTTYNFGAIPFAYPPLGLYMAAIVEAVTPLDMLGVTRFLPLLFNMLTIAAVYSLSLAMLSSRTAAGVAAITFALLPRSYTWLIVGGGLTRSPALLFSVLGILGLYLFYTRRRWRYLIPATGFAGLAVLTHPEVGWFTAFTYALFFLLHGLHKRGLLGSAAAALGVLVISAPWWGTVVVRHGMDPFLAAASTGGHDVAGAVLRSLWYLNFTEEPYGRLLAALGALGAFAAIARGNFTLPIWFVIMFVLEPRSAYTYATIPLAMMISLLVTAVLVPGLRRAPWAEHKLVPLAGASDDSFRTRLLPRFWTSGIAVALLLAFLSTYATISALNANEHILTAVPEGDMAAMRWVEENTPPESTFLVMVYSHWPNDRVGEWFPAITGRHSIATVQGSEWLADDMFQWKQSRFYHLISCAHQDLSCVQHWQSLEAQEYDYIYLSEGCCGAGLIGSLQDSPQHELVYGTRQVGIWQYKPPQPSGGGDTLGRQGSSWSPRSVP